LLRGRRGHARAVVVTIVDDELTAVLNEFRANVEVEGSGCWASESREDATYPVLITQSVDRSNMPCAETVRDIIEDWQPEFVLLVGIAGGIVRTNHSMDGLEGPFPGDVVCIEYVHYGEYTKRVNGQRLLRYYPIEHPASEILQRQVRPISRTPWHEGLPLDRPALAPGSEPRLHFGEIVAVEFLAGDATVEQQREIFSQYDHALAVDMESAGVARAMHRASSDVHYRPVWLGLRGISDRTAATPEAQVLLPADNDSERRLWRDYAASAAARVARLCVERLLAHARPSCSEDPGAPPWSRDDA
jgi:nucleoside phosphorylase